MSQLVTEQALELGRLLAGAATAVVEAQEALDRHAEAQEMRFMETPNQRLAVPPSWFSFRRVTVDIELSAEIDSELVGPTGAAPAALEPRLRCRMLNPTSVGLYGYQASSGLRVAVVLEPRERSNAEAQVDDVDGNTTNGPG
jgi:hypothetical protein